jgi:predicted amidohydrolase YtcJ
MYTEYSAVQGRYGAERGRLEPGYVGDIVVLSTDLATCASEDLDAVDVGWTIVDGSVVFERGSA